MGIQLSDFTYLFKGAKIDLKKSINRPIIVKGDNYDSSRRYFNKPATRS